MILTNGHLYDPSLGREIKHSRPIFMESRPPFFAIVFSVKIITKKMLIGAFFCYKEVRPYNQGQSIDILGSNPVEKYLAKQRLRTMCVVKYLKKYRRGHRSFFEKIKISFSKIQKLRAQFFFGDKEKFVDRRSLGR